MKIDLTRNDTGNLSETVFPDGVRHLRLANVPIVPGWTADLRCAVYGCADLWRLLSFANAVEHAGGRLGRLDLPYLMGGRYDRVMLPGDAVDIQVVADLINGLEFQRIRVFEPHSDVTTLLLRRSEAVSCESVVSQFALDNPVLFLPDAGAAKRYAQAEKWLGGVLATHVAHKTRDVSTGRLRLELPAPVTLAEGQTGLVLDDLCDGGATFVELAKQIKREPGSRLVLYVSHGIFSRGLQPFKGLYDDIFVSDSWPVPHNGGPATTVFRCPI